LREVFLPSFEAAVKEARVMSVMPSYNEIDGVPSHINKWLLDDILRKEWGFQGYTTADYYALTQLQEIHNVVNDKSEAAKLAIETGVDVETPDPDIYVSLIQLVKDKKVAEATLDRSVARVLRTKFLL
jgi:beta-glucosidase